MRTDHLDLFHLHSCPLEILQRENILEACRALVRSGKVRVVAYSGEEEALSFAVECGVFGAIQCSVNLCDQRSLDHQVAGAHQAGLGVIAKRPLANAVWLNRPNREDAAAVTYQARFPLLGIDAGGLPWDELFLRFSAFAPGVSTALVGSTRLENVRKNVEAISRGPLPAPVFDGLRERFGRVGRDWPGQI